MIRTSSPNNGHCVIGTSNRYGAIVIMGVSGCGKSTVGRLLAADLNCAFIEGDDLHDAACIAKMQSGTPLTDDDRRPWLDRLGHAMRTQVAANGAVVASCSALKYSYRERLVQATSAPISFILLDATRAVLLDRLKDRAGHFMPASLLDSQLSTLERPTRLEPALTLDAAATPEQLCRSIGQWLGG